MSYKGFPVNEVLLSGQTVVVIDAPCGCNECQQQNRVISNHRLCSLIPEVLVDDRNCRPYLDDSKGWVLLFIGEDLHVDSWLN